MLGFDADILFVLLIIYILSIVLRSVRWQLMINSKNAIAIIPVFKSLAIGYMINNLLPAKVGEIARMEYLKRHHGIGRSFLLGTIFLERLLDISMVLISLLISVVFSETIRGIIQHKQWLFIAIILSISLFVFLMMTGRGVRWLVKITPEKFKIKLHSIATSFSESMHFIKNKKQLTGVVLLSASIWFLTLATTYSILVGLNTYLPFYAYFFIITAGVFGLVIPSTSGGIGVYHAIATGSLVLFGVPSALAMSYAIIAHAFDFFPGILTGGAVALFDSVKTKSL